MLIPSIKREDDTPAVRARQSWVRRILLDSLTQLKSCVLAASNLAGIRKETSNELVRINAALERTIQLLREDCMAVADSMKEVENAKRQPRETTRP